MIITKRNLWKDPYTKSVTADVFTTMMVSAFSTSASPWWVSRSQWNVNAYLVRYAPVVIRVFFYIHPNGAIENCRKHNQRRSDEREWEFWRQRTKNPPEPCHPLPWPSAGWKEVDRLWMIIINGYGGILCDIVTLSRIRRFASWSWCFQFTNWESSVVNS